MAALFAGVHDKTGDLEKAILAVLERTLSAIAAMDALRDTTGWGLARAKVAVEDVLPAFTEHLRQLDSGDHSF